MTDMGSKFGELTDETHRALATVEAEIKCNPGISSAARVAWKYLEDNCYLIGRGSLPCEVSDTLGRMKQP